MGACFGKKCEAAAAVVPSCHPCRAGAVLRLFAVELRPSTASIRMALHHKGVPVDTIWVPDPNSSGGGSGGSGADGDVSSAATKIDWILSTVGGAATSFPALQHGSAVVHGSADDVLDYIDATFRDPPLLRLPESDDRSGMDIRDWVDYIRATFAPLLHHALYDLEDGLGLGSGSDGEAEEVSARLEAAFSKLDRGIYEHSRGGGPYFFGSVLTMVDVYLVPLLEFLRPLAFFRGLELRSLHSHLVAYVGRCVHFPGYASAARLDPDLLDMSVSRAIHERAPPPLVALTLLQHRSIGRHLSRMVDVSGTLASTPLDNATSPVKAASTMELRRLASQYASLVQIMQEHAQMEERSILAAIEEANAELTAAVHSDHARDLPIMNGIREDLKSVMSLQQGSGIHGEALVALATRLKVFQDCTRDHFAEEEREILPLLDTIGFAAEQQCSAMELVQTLMESSHGRLFPFLLQGLQPHEMHLYVSILQSCLGSEAAMVACLKHVLESGAEYSAIRKVVRQRFSAICELVPVREDSSLRMSTSSRKLEEELSNC